MKINKILLVYLKPKRKEERDTLVKVKNVIKDYDVQILERDERDPIHVKLFKNKDLVITAGGDGTFLSSAHHILDDTLLFGVNANPSIKEGFYAHAKFNDFEAKFNELVEGKAKILKLMRLEARINKRLIDERALNEVYMGPLNAFMTSVYTIQIKNCKERHKSSGVIIATPTGSHAWTRSAGGQVLGIQDRKFEVTVREPYLGNLTNCGKFHTMLGIKEKIKIISQKNNNIVVIDSLSKIYKFKEKSVLQVGVSDCPLSAVWS